jgi:hypothetical protein
MAQVTGLMEPKITISASVIKSIEHTIKGIVMLTGKTFDDINPDCVKKLMISTNINDQKLLDYTYKMEFSLEEAITDCFDDCNQTRLY